MSDPFLSLNSNEPQKDLQAAPTVAGGTLEAKTLPTIEEMCGFIHDLTNGMTLKEYLEDMDEDF